MKRLIPILLYIWQLPQNIVGLIVKACYTKKSSLEYKDKTVLVCPNFPGGVSLGDTLIVTQYPFSTITWNSVKHEWGHSRQSLMLGPLYLFVVGIPSGIWYLICRYNPQKLLHFYEFYTEKWADKLGGVERRLPWE